MMHIMSDVYNEANKEKPMTDREKLIELLESAESAFYWNSDDRGFLEKIADHLISHGVTFEKQGEWKKQWHDNNLIGHEYEECSICGCIISDDEKFWDCNYCPNCGAKMKGE